CVPPPRNTRPSGQGESSASGNATSFRRRSANSYSTTSACGTRSAGRCSTAEHVSGVGTSLPLSPGPQLLTADAGGSPSMPGSALDRAVCSAKSSRRWSTPADDGCLSSVARTSGTASMVVAAMIDVPLIVALGPDLPDAALKRREGVRDDGQGRLHPGG